MGREGPEKGSILPRFRAQRGQRGGPWGGGEELDPLPAFSSPWRQREQPLLLPAACALMGTGGVPHGRQRTEGMPTWRDLLAASPVAH